MSSPRRGGKACLLPRRWQDVDERIADRVPLAPPVLFLNLSHIPPAAKSTHQLASSERKSPPHQARLSTQFLRNPPIPRAAKNRC